MGWTKVAANRHRRALAGQKWQRGDWLNHEAAGCHVTIDVLRTQNRWQHLASCSDGQENDHDRVGSGRGMEVVSLTQAVRILQMGSPSFFQVYIG